jgi:hypothetical protein
MQTRPERDQQQRAQFICRILCERGRSYIGETGIPLAMWLHGHRHNLKDSFLEKSSLQGGS